METGGRGPHSVLRTEQTTKTVSGVVHYNRNDKQIKNRVRLFVLELKIEKYFKWSTTEPVQRSHRSKI